MSYTPTVWASGDTVTATKMNKIENGIAGAGGGGLMVTVTESSGTYTCNKTYSEIAAAATTMPIFLVYDNSNGNDTSGTFEEGINILLAVLIGDLEVNTSNHTFTASSSSGYPSYTSGPPK